MAYFAFIDPIHKLYDSWVYFFTISTNPIRPHHKVKYQTLNSPHPQVSFETDEQLDN